MANGANCVRIDEDQVRGGFVFSSTLPDNDDTVFYTYGEVHHFLERVKLGYFDGVQDRAQEQALKFGASELTPLTAEHAARDYDTAKVSA
jgi:hypothetical protein